MKKAKEIRRRENNLVNKLDAKNLASLRDREPEIVKAINDLLDVDMSAAEIGRIVRRSNPQMWVESKFAESVARALIEEAAPGRNDGDPKRQPLRHFGGF